MSKINKKLDNLCIDSIKINSCAITSKVQKGDWASSISVAKILHTLFCYNLIFNPKDPSWINRDRFILSTNAFLPAFYSIQRIIGNLTKFDLENYATQGICKVNADKNLKINLETNVDDSSRNIVIGIGMAIAESILSQKFDEINHKTYILCNERDLQNGYVQEALSLAGTFKLNKLIILCNSNGIQYDSFSKTVNNVNLKNEYKAKKFKFIEINNSVSKLNNVLKRTKFNSKPLFIKINTIFAEDTIYENNNIAFDNYLNNDDISDLKDMLLFKKSDNFETYKSIKDLYKDNINLRINKKYKSWIMTSKLNTFLNESIKINLNDITWENKENIFTKIINNISEKFENIIFMSPDQNRITHIDTNSNSYASNNRNTSKFLIGNRYLSIGDLANGIALHSNFRPIISSTINNAKYFIPALNFAKLQNISPIYILMNNNVDNNNHSLENLRNFNVYQTYFNKDIINSFEKILNENNKNPSLIVSNFTNEKKIINLNLEKNKDISFFLLKSKLPYTILASGYHVEKAYDLATKLNFSLLFTANINDLKNINYDIDKTIAIHSGDFNNWDKYAKFEISPNNLNLILNKNHSMEFNDINILEAIKKLNLKIK